MRLNPNLRGDTIVEVLISIAIVGLVIAGSYALSSHSLQEGVSASERTQANKLAAAQIEALKTRIKVSMPATWTSDFANLTQASGSFCFDTTATSELATNWKPVTNNNNFNSAVDQNLNGSYYNTGTCTADNQKYWISVRVQQNNNGGSNPGQVYLVVVRWQALGGGPLNQSQLYYKVPPQQGT